MTEDQVLEADRPDLIGELFIKHICSLSGDRDAANEVPLNRLPVTVLPLTQSSPTKQR